MDAALGIFSIIVIGLLVLLAIASLVYFILVVVQMFKHDQSVMGIVCIVFFLCSGGGQIIAYIMGWVKAGEWGIKSLMWQWTGVWVAIVLLACCGLGGIQIMGKNANSAFGTVGSSIGATVSAGR
jgi:hypothetical protein